MAWTGKQYTVTATAAALSTILGTDDPGHAKYISFYNAGSNPVYLGASNVTNVPANAFVKIVASGGWNTGSGSDVSICQTSKIYVVGTAADILHIAVMY
jgi:hypothetical protein